MKDGTIKIKNKYYILSLWAIILLDAIIVGNEFTSVGPFCFTVKFGALLVACGGTLILNPTYKYSLFLKCVYVYLATDILNEIVTLTKSLESFSLLSLIKLPLYFICIALPTAKYKRRHAEQVVYSEKLKKAWARDDEYLKSGRWTFFHRKLSKDIKSCKYMH